MKLKDRIKDESDLSQKIDSVLRVVTEEVRGAVGHLEQDYIRYQERLKLMFFFAILAFIVIQIEQTFGIVGGISAFGSVLLLIICIVAFIYTLVGLISDNSVVRNFHYGVNQVVYKHVAMLFGGTLKHLQKPIKKRKPTVFRSILQDSKTTRSVLSRIKASELVTQNYNQHHIDDVFELSLEGSSVHVSEVELMRKGDKSEYTVFKGYFVVTKLQRPLKGKTFVTTDNDTSGYAGLSVLSGILKSDMRETVLEWNEFEGKLRVTTNSEVEARYILSTDFMDDLYSWWKEKHSKIRISFVGEHMYLVFPDESLRFNHTLNNISEKETREYMLSVARPLMHVVHLIEDVKV